MGQCMYTYSVFDESQNRKSELLRRYPALNRLNRLETSSFSRGALNAIRS